MLEKRGVSPVIATVLLLLLTLVIVSILAIFVIPFVQRNLQGGGDCFDVLGDLKFDDSNYNCNCVNESNADIKGTGFSVRIDSEDIAGFKVSLFKQGSADQFDIKNGTQLANIRMLGGQFNGLLEIPVKGGIRTYVANGTYERIEINPILKSGKLCDERQRTNVLECVDPVVINGVCGY